MTNHLPEPTTVHWHGLILPNEMDGPSEITQDPIEPGETLTYEFAVDQPGTFFYHSHHEADRQQALGLYGALVVDPADPKIDAAYDYDHDLVVMLQEWLEREGFTYPAMLMEGALPNFFTINGKAYPDTEPLRMQVGQRVRVRTVGPGERYDVIWEARRPGRWLLHCHIAHHMTNDGVEVQGGGGLTMVIHVT